MAEDTEMEMGMGMESERIKGTIMTMFSTASAVGKTLISCNLASALAKNGAKVCLVDLDLQFGDICNYLQIQPNFTIADAQQALNAQGENFNIEEYLTTYSYGGVEFSVLPAPVKLEEAYNMNPAGIITMLTKLQSSYGYVIIDTTSMFSVLNLDVLEISTIVLFMGIVDFIPTIKNMKIGTDTLRGLNYDRNKIRLILNRGGSDTRISMKDVQHLLGSEFDFILPNDFRAASTSIKTGVPVVLEDDTTALGKGIRQLVTRYTSSEDYENNEPMAKSGGWLSRLFG